MRLSTLLVALTFCWLSVSCFSTAQDQARLMEIKRLWLTIPIHPSMHQVNEFESVGFRKAYVSRAFSSQGTYDEVKQFYAQRLAADGWQLISESMVKDWERNLGGRALEFRKGDYKVTIEYSGERANKGWEYSIGVGWIA